MVFGEFFLFITVTSHPDVYPPATPKHDAPPANATLENGVGKLLETGRKAGKRSLVSS